MKIPSSKDPRWIVAALLTIFVIVGITLLGFNRSAAQVCFTVTACIGLDLVFHLLVRGGSAPFPLSAYISGMGLSILVNYAHGYQAILLPLFFTVSSKYLLTFDHKHIYNPTLFGIVATLFLGDGMISPAPAYQWGGSLAVVMFIVTLAVLLFVPTIRRTTLILSFLGLYALSAFVRAWATRHHMPIETVFLGPLSSPAFYLFTFFMITDPKTSPASARGQFMMAAIVVFFDFILHMRQMLSTLFLAGFTYFSGRLLYLHLRAGISIAIPKLQYALRACTVTGVLGAAVGCAYISHPRYYARSDVGFSLVKLSSEDTSITGNPSDVLTSVDPRIAPVAKWLLSVGDAVAVADVDNDGLQDLFFTQPLKAPHDRGVLYLNRGRFSFERYPLPQLDEMRAKPATEGLISGALWLDIENDGDQDLLVLAGFGKPRLLKNLLKEEGHLGFRDATAEVGLPEYTISVAANAADFNGDGLLDLVMADVMPQLLPDYDPPEPFNIFRLPPPAFEGDRRMLNVMHRSWHNANNGGQKRILLNTGGTFTEAKLPEAFRDRRWSLAIAAGDLNADALPDIYVANDFGPDELFINKGGMNFELVRSGMVSEISHDTYKGMNASFKDVDGNGFPDIYVSNVHERLQAEGSLLWMNNGRVSHDGATAFRDEAAARNALNERRFGWGASLVDIDLDGSIDILQANGMVGDEYDKRDEVCPDYWYWNAQIALTPPDIHGYVDRWADLRGRCIFHLEKNRAYLNRGEYFVDVADSIGWGEKGTSRGVASVDLDNDGRPDVVVTHMLAEPDLFRNEATNNSAVSWIGLQLRGNGTSCNTDAIGTVASVRITRSGNTIHGESAVYAANGFAAQEDRRLVFGFGAGNVDDGVADVLINWCGRERQEVRLALNAYHTIEQEGAIARTGARKE